jgi:hypothetical protein
MSDGASIYSFREKVIERLNSLQTPQQKRAFAQALYMSIKLDESGTVPPCPISPFLISDQCGFNIKQLKQQHIVLDKDGAIEFLNHFGSRVESVTSFKRKHSRYSYQDFFQRRAPVTGGKNLVCTYAEWLHMESYPFEPELPSELMSYIPDGWELPDPNLPIGNPPLQQ